jgi:hypothetical protein
MSKIPQGEWNAIAARYAQGESISRIAQSYGCTPPAIHYILKRNKTRTVQKSERPLNGRPELIPTSTGDKLQTPFASATSRSAELRREEYGGFRPAPSEVGSPPAPTNQQQASRDPGLASPMRPTQAEQRSPPSPQPQPGHPQTPGRASALAAGLDHELHGRAEAAIEAFRSSFAAALTESSSSARLRLREAASDLMRVAARTTIVLDRLSANVERASMRVPNHLRSTQTGEYP